MSVAVFDRELPDEDAPNIVRLPHVMGQFEVRDEWLAQNAVGAVGYRLRICDNPSRMIISYRFSDANTAFWFKMRFR